MTKASREFVYAMSSLMLTLYCGGERLFFKKAGITALQFYVLKRVEVEKTTTMMSIARYLGVRPQTMTDMVDLMEKKGWVKRLPSTTDRRTRIISLAQRGVRMVKSTELEIASRLEKIMDAAPEDSLIAARRALSVAKKSYRTSKDSSR